MLDKTRGVVTGAVRDLLLSWRSLAITDIAYKFVAFALLTPVVTGLLYWLRSGTSFRVMADADILRFFVTTPVGVVTLVLGGSLIVAVTALEIACLMAIGLAAANGKQMRATSALRFAAAHAPNVLRLALNMVVRLLAGLLPFVLGAGLVYWALLRPHDINFYLAQRPPVFWVAVVLVAMLAFALAALLVRTIARWAFALPLVLFEGISPRLALGESAKRSIGHRSLVVMVLATWAVVAVALITVARWLPEFLGRAVAPHAGGSLALLLPFIAGLALLWACSSSRRGSPTSPSSRSSSRASISRRRVGRIATPRPGGSGSAPAAVRAGQGGSGGRRGPRRRRLRAARVLRHPAEPAGAGDRPPRGVLGRARELARGVSPGGRAGSRLRRARRAGIGRRRGRSSCTTPTS